MIKTDWEGRSFEQIEDAIGEITDGIMPIYNSDIIGEWQAMPSEYDGRGVAEFGLPSEPTVYTLMTGDLYFYYYDLVSDALTQLEDEGHFNEEAY